MKLIEKTKYQIHRGEGTLSCTVKREKKKKKKGSERFIRQIVLQGQNIQIWTGMIFPLEKPRKWKS